MGRPTTTAQSRPLVARHSSPRADRHPSASQEEERRLPLSGGARASWGKITRSAGESPSRAMVCWISRKQALGSPAVALLTAAATRRMETIKPTSFSPGVFALSYHKFRQGERGGESPLPRRPWGKGGRAAPLARGRGAKQGRWEQTLLGCQGRRRSGWRWIRKIHISFTEDL